MADYYTEESDYEIEERINRAKKKKKRKKRRIRFLVFLIIIIAIAVPSVLYPYNYVKGKTLEAKERIKNLDGTRESFESVSVIRFRQAVKAKSYTEMEDLYSDYAILVDADSCKIIAGKNYDEQFAPASMTKVMSLVVVAENMKDFKQTYTFSPDELQYLIIKMNASMAGYLYNETATAEDLLYGMILPSGADAATALATMTCGSQEEFVDKMNETAKRIGMKNTHFANPTGLSDSDNYSTPEDIARLMQYAMHNELCEKVLTTYTYTTAATNRHPDGITFTSGALSRMEGANPANTKVIAGKTGMTFVARYCLVTMGIKNGRHYIAVNGKAFRSSECDADQKRIYEVYAK